MPIKPGEKTAKEIEEHAVREMQQKMETLLKNEEKLENLQRQMQDIQASTADFRRANRVANADDGVKMVESADNIVQAAVSIGKTAIELAKGFVYQVSHPGAVDLPEEKQRTAKQPKASVKEKVKPAPVVKGKNLHDETRGLLKKTEDMRNNAETFLEKAKVLNQRAQRK